MIEGHGNDLYRYGGKVCSDFSSNVVARRVPEVLLRFMSTQWDAVAAYPEPDSESLRRILGKKLGVHSTQVFVTNGATEAFYIIAAAFRERRSLVFTPSFAEYEDACRMHGHTLLFKSNALLHESYGVHPNLVWLGNPNNPDGRLYSKTAIKEQLRLNPDTVFMVDEAYGELCHGFESVVDLLAEFENLIVVKSMTKQYVLPGLRLGYMVTSPLLAGKLCRWRVPWSVNAIAQRVGSFILDNEVSLTIGKDNVLHRSVGLQQRLAALPGTEVFLSPCNFFLLRLLHCKAVDLKTFLLQEHGLLVRDASNFRGLDNHFIRISVQAEAENEQLFLAIKSFLEQRAKGKGL